MSGRTGAALVGRDAMLADLTDWLAPSIDGRGRAVLLQGEAGVGKSSIAHAITDRLAAAGCRVLRAWCSAAGMPPYWPWRRALAPVAGKLSFEAVGTGGDDRPVLFAAVVEVLDCASREQPLLLVLEDIHWAELPSLLLLSTVVEAVPAQAVAVLLTARDDPGEMPEPAREALRDLPTHLRRVPVPMLDTHAAQRLVHRIAGDSLDERTVSDVVSRTGGNPFYLTEVARLLATSYADSLARRGFVVPPGVQEVLRRRLARLSQPCHALLAAAAVAAETGVAGRDPVDEELLTAVVGRHRDEMATLLDEAVRARLLVDDPVARHLGFAHALVREVLVADLSRLERGRLHREVAQALEERGDGGDAERLAHHWSRAAGPDAPARAASWSLEAARAAVEGLGFEQAAAHLRRALATPGSDRVGVLLRLGEAQRLSGDIAGARSSFVEAAGLARAAGRATDLATAALGLGGGIAGFEVPIGDREQVELLRAALTALPVDDTPLRAAVIARLSVALTGLGSGLERRRLAEAAVAMAERAGARAVMVAALAAYCDAVAGPDYVRQRLVSADRMLAVAPDRVAALLARRLRLVALLESGDLSAVDNEIAMYERVADLAGISLYRWLPALWRGMRSLLAGDIAAAFRHAEVAEGIGRRAGSGNAEMLVLTLRMQAHLMSGTAPQIVEPVRRIQSTVGDAAMPVTYRAAPAVVLAAAGDTREGEDVLRCFQRTPGDDIIQDAEWIEGHWALAELAVRLGDRTVAARLADTLRPYERIWAVDGIGAAVFGTVGHQLGRLAAFLGRHREAARYLGTAADTYERVGAPLLVGQARAALADLPGTPSGVQGHGPAQVGRIRREGRFWRLSWGDRTSTVPDRKGMRDLAVLLTHPDRPVAAVDLVTAGTAPTGGDLGPVLDTAARRAYRSRLAELEERMADAAADADELERLRAERTAIVAELSSALGLGGRTRTVGDPIERARKAVTMRIRDAVRAIEAVDPALARHLRNAVKTGRLCSYEPDTPVTWQA